MRSRSLGDAGWSSPVARQAHNLKVAGSNPAPATNNQSDHTVGRLEALTDNGVTVRGWRGVRNTDVPVLIG